MKRSTGLFFFFFHSLREKVDGCGQEGQATPGTVGASCVSLCRIFSALKAG